MARDIHGRTLREGDPVISYGRRIKGTVRTAAVAQTCITVDWAGGDGDPCCEGPYVEYWGPEEQARWDEARAAGMPAIRVDADVSSHAGGITIVDPAMVREEPKPKAPAMVTKRDAHKAPAHHPGRGPKAS